MFICVTEVDFLTKIPCTEAPQSTGPSMPEVKGLKLDWANQSIWPIPLSPEGVYLRAPLYYGVCDDDADTNLNGVIEILSESEWMQRKHDEFYARKPFDSWTWNADNMTWNAPIPYPSNEPYNKYYWDESLLAWTERQIINPPL